MYPNPLTLQLFQSNQWDVYIKIMILGSQAKKTSQLLQLSVNFFPNLIITFAGYFKIYAFHSVLPNIHFVFMSITYQFHTSISFFFLLRKHVQPLQEFSRDFHYFWVILVKLQFVPGWQLVIRVGLLISTWNNQSSYTTAGLQILTFVKVYVNLKLSVN